MTVTAPPGIRFSDIETAYPATWRLLRRDRAKSAVTTFMIRTVADVHGKSGRPGSRAGSGSGVPILWTADQIRAAATRAVILHSFGLRCNIPTSMQQLVDAVWTYETVIVTWPDATVIVWHGNMDAARELGAVS